LGDERAVHADLEDQDEGEERLGVVRFGQVVPRVDDAQHRDERRQREERERDAVDAEVIPAVDDVDPGVVDLELQRARPVIVEVGKDPDHDAQCRQRCEERDPLDQFLLRTRDEHHDDCADRG
jgi:hypothetical protein